MFSMFDQIRNFFVAPPAPNFDEYEVIVIGTGPASQAFAQKIKGKTALFIEAGTGGIDQQVQASLRFKETGQITGWMSHCLLAFGGTSRAWDGHILTQAMTKGEMTHFPVRYDEYIGYIEEFDRSRFGGRSGSKKLHQIYEVAPRVSYRPTSSLFVDLRDPRKLAKFDLLLSSPVIRLQFSRDGSVTSICLRSQGRDHVVSIKKSTLVVSALGGDFQ